MENKEGASNNTASFSQTQHEGSSLPPATGSEMEPPSPRPHGDLMGPSNLLPPPPPPDHLVAPPGPENPNLVPMDRPIAVVALPVQDSSSASKKREGRLRKNNPEGSLSANLPPMPISSSGPVLSTSNFGFQPRGRGRGRGSVTASASASASGGTNNDNRFRNPQMNRQMSELDPSPNAGEGPSMGFHVLTVNAGEDVMRKIMEIDQQVSQAIYISSAIGSISDVVLRQPMTPGGTVTYKGQFEILSLTGYFIPREDGGRGGGMSVSLARPDCSVFGGRLSGFLIAAGPVMVDLVRFVTHQEESQQQIKKQRREGFGILATTQVANTSSAGSEEDPNARHRLNKPVVLQPRPVSAPPNLIQPVPVSEPPASFSHGPSTDTVHVDYPNDSMMEAPLTSLPRVDEDDDFKAEDEDEDEDEDFVAEDEDEDEDDDEDEDGDEFGDYNESD